MPRGTLLSAQQPRRPWITCCLLLVMMQVNDETYWYLPDALELADASRGTSTTPDTSTTSAHCPGAPAPAPALKGRCPAAAKAAQPAPKPGHPITVHNATPGLRVVRGPDWTSGDEVRHGAVSYIMNDQSVVLHALPIIHWKRMQHSRLIIPGPIHARAGKCDACHASAHLLFMCRTGALEAWAH